MQAPNLRRLARGRSPGYLLGMRSPLLRFRRLLRHVPSRRRLKGGFLHRTFGERLFAVELWHPHRERYAAGLALGTFVALTPLMGLHLLIAGLLALYLRVNIPLALAATFITNPFTAPAIYPLQFKLGVWLVGTPMPRWIPSKFDLVDLFVSRAIPLWVGSLITATLGAALVYGLIYFSWATFERLRAARAARRQARRSNP